MVGILGKTKPAYRNVRGPHSLPEGSFIALADELADYGATLSGERGYGYLKPTTTARLHGATGRRGALRLQVPRGAVNGSKLVLIGMLDHMGGWDYPLPVRAVVIGGHACTVIPTTPGEAPTLKAWSLDTLGLVAGAP